MDGASRPTWRRPETWAGLAVVLLLAGFVVAFGARPAVVVSTASIDDGLFVSLAQSLARGRWLGPYSELTLAKGPGFPAFLAGANVLGLPFPLALALFHAACASFAAFVAYRVTGSRWMGVAMLAALLLAPHLYDGEMMRVFREVFYGSLVVALASAVIALSTGAVRASWKLAAATGLLGAWAWLTREEGVWLAPLALLFLTPVLVRANDTPAPRLLVGLRPAAIAFAVGVAAVAGFGLVNWAVYGRFVVNEIKDGAFQGAMDALQEASAPYHKTGVPVPGQARARIYAESPAFASLKEPYLDGRLQAEATQWGCLQNKAMCGDFGGGWFLWSLRSSAADKGHHAGAGEAARFYRQLEHEVRDACAAGRLTCKPWRVPLVPPMTADETDDVARSLASVVDVVTFGSRVAPDQLPSDLSAPGAARMTRFLNVPTVETPGRLRMRGWYRSEGPGWFTLAPGAGVEVFELRRLESPDLVAAFGDAQLARQRFTLDAQCPAGPACPVVLTPEGGAPQSLDLAKVVRGDNPVGRANLFLDDAGREQSGPYLKESWSQAWGDAAASLGPVYRGLVLIGLVAYAAILVAAALRRQLSPAVIICSSLLIAVAARCVILALIDALSFRAASTAYALPATLLLVMYSLYAVHAAIRLRVRPA